jgi:DivIVA domain-containing protein
MILVGGVLFLLVSFVFGRGEALAPMPPDAVPVELPEDRPAGPEDLHRLRLPVVLRGYRMHEVDWVLDRLATELELRDAEIARLRAELAGDPSRGDQMRGDQTHDGPSRGDQVRGDQTHGGQSRGDQVRGDQTYGGQSRGDQTHGDPSRGDQMRAGPSRGERADGGPQRPGLLRGGPLRGDPDSAGPTPAEPAEEHR